MNSHNTFPQLETERLILREIGLQDAEGVFQNFSDEEITDMIGMGRFFTLKDAEELIEEFLAYFEKGTGLAWAITLKETDTFIGTCTFEELDTKNSRGEIGYDLLRDCWGKGLMSEALRAVISYGFEELELNRIDAHTFSINEKSRNMLKRLGFTEEGILRENTRFKGKFRSEVMYSVLKREWETL